MYLPNGSVDFREFGRAVLSDGLGSLAFTVNFGVVGCRLVQLSETGQEVIIISSEHYAIRMTGTVL